MDFFPLSDFTCNGKLFGYYPESGDGIDAGYMVISGRNCATNKVVYLRFSGVEPEIGQLNFFQPTYADSCFPAYSYTNIDQDNGFVTFENLVSGSMNLTSFTPRQPNDGPFGKIEGSFEFTVTNENSDSTIYITDGAFRFKVPHIW